MPGESSTFTVSRQVDTSLIRFNLEKAVQCIHQGLNRMTPWTFQHLTVPEQEFKKKRGQSFGLPIDRIGLGHLQHRRG